jgi:ribosome-associated protein
MPTESNPHQTTSTRELLVQLCRALDDKKAEEIVVLDVARQSSITNYLVVATGTSEPHLRALRGALDQVIDATGTKVVGIDAGDGSGWSVVDAFDVMVHVLTPENRERYRLESLWGDAERVSIASLLQPEAPGAEVAPKKRAARKAAAKKSTAKKPAATKKVARKTATKAVRKKKARA